MLKLVHYYTTSEVTIKIEGCDHQYQDICAGYLDRHNRLINHAHCTYADYEVM